MSSAPARCSLNVVILWLVRATDAHACFLQAWLFGTNTVLAVLLQVPAARAVNSVSTSLPAAHQQRVLRPLLLRRARHPDARSGDSRRAGLLGHVTRHRRQALPVGPATGASSELSDPRRRGVPRSPSSATLGSVWAPAALHLPSRWVGATGWMLIAAVIVIAVLGMGPAAAAGRYLARTGQPTAA